MVRSGLTQVVSTAPLGDTDRHALPQPKPRSPVLWEWTPLVSSWTEELKALSHRPPDGGSNGHRTLLVAPIGCQGALAGLRRVAGD